MLAMGPSCRFWRRSRPRANPTSHRFPPRSPRGRPTWLSSYSAKRPDVHKNIGECGIDLCGRYGQSNGEMSSWRTRLLRARVPADLFSSEGVLDHPKHPEEMLLGHLAAGFDTDSVAQT